MGNVGLPSFNVDYDVIKKEKDKMMCKGFKDVVHETF
jgi:hypothetical protein